MGCCLGLTALSLHLAPPKTEECGPYLLCAHCAMWSSCCPAECRTHVVPSCPLSMVVQCWLTAAVTGGQAPLVTAGTAHPATWPAGHRLGLFGHVCTRVASPGSAGD